MTENSSIIDIIENHINSEDGYPVLNPHAIKIQREITKNDPDFRVIQQLIQKDPILTSEILKTANSAFYKGLYVVETIKDAILRLGQTAMVTIVMQVILKSHFSSTDPTIKDYQKKLWHHSVVCATGASWTARYLSMDDLISKAFIGGLLHDIGKLFILTAIESIIKSDQQTIKLQPELITTLLNRFHTVQGHALLTKWNLPKAYCIIARDHHLESYDSSDVLLSLVRIANRISTKIELNDPDQDLYEIINSQEADNLGLSDTGIAELEIIMEDAYKKLIPK